MTHQCKRTNEKEIIYIYIDIFYISIKEKSEPADREKASIDMTGDRARGTDW